MITLTSDLGYKDFYLAAVKGSIVTQLPNTQIIDISHSVAPFNIAQGAFLFRNAFPHFPRRTVHILGVNCDYSNNPEFLALAYREHYLLGPDNGIFSLICEEFPEKLVKINLNRETKFPHFALLDVLVPCACHLAAGGTLNTLGDDQKTWIQKMDLKPVMGPGFIRGTVIYIDEYQNVITNITRKHFEERIKGRFEIRFKRNETINKISYHYGEVPEGEKLSLFGISEHLEIAINKGKASGLLGLRMDDTIQIDYEEVS